MRLVGSLSEQSFREELSKSWSGLREPGNQLFSILTDRLGSIGSAFVLSWIPEQAEDFYVVLVNGSEVIWLEVLRLNGEAAVFQNIDVKEYERSLRSRQSRIKLAVALDLASKYGK